MSCVGGKNHGPARVCNDCHLSAMRDQRTQGRLEARNELWVDSEVGRRFLRAALPYFAPGRHLFEPDAEGKCTDCGEARLGRSHWHLDQFNEIEEFLATMKERLGPPKGEQDAGTDRGTGS